MSITPIARPLPGERVVALSPEDVAEAASTWLARPNLFAGRALTAPTLERRQRWQAGRLALRGQCLTAGVFEGLEVGHELLPPEPPDTTARVRLSVAAGRALTASGEDLVVPGPFDIDLLRLPVFAEPSLDSADEDDPAPSDPPPEGSQVRARVVLRRDLGALFAAAPNAIPGVGILVLQPVLADQLGEFDPTDPCELSNCGDAGDNTSFEDWRIGDAARLLWYPWPVEWRNLPTDATTLRNALAMLIFAAEATLPPDAVLPWEELGAPLALIALDASRQPAFIDRASVVRAGGRTRDPRLSLNATSIEASSRAPLMWQARIEQLAEQIAATGEPAPDAGMLAKQFLHLPPAGLLPTNAIDLTVLPLNAATESLSSQFFPDDFALDAVPVPLECLDLAMRESAALAPIDLAASERVRVLVPVPQAVYEPRLLLEEIIDPEFQQTLDTALLARARALGARQGLRTTISGLLRLATGRAVAVPAIETDPDALENESVTPWGPPPTSGGHRSVLAGGLHRHAFAGGSSTFAFVAKDLVYVWTYLDPDNPPRVLMFEWIDVTGVAHRAYWAATGDENLIPLGNDGTSSRMRIGPLPEPGRWVRLDIPVASVALTDATLSSMAFLLFNGQAAYASVGRVRTGREATWFATSLPGGAVIPDDSDPWTFLPPNALNAPFEPTFGLDVDLAANNPLGASAAITELLADPALAPLKIENNVLVSGVLSATELAQLGTRGLEGFTAMLKSRADRADDLIDYGFVKVQTDTYRMRQLILGTTAATRLAVSPALATIAQSETAVASQERIAGFFNELKAAPAPAPSDPDDGKDAAAAPNSGRTLSVTAGATFALPTGTRAPAAGVGTLFASGGSRAGGVSPGSSLPTINLGRDLGFLQPDTRKSAVDLALNLNRDNTVLLGANRTYSPGDVTNVDPVVGKPVIRTTSIAQRLEQPKALEAKDYSTATRFDSTRALLRLADELTKEDRNVTPGLFAGIDVYGLSGDPFLRLTADEQREDEGKRRRSVPLATFIADRTRLTELLSVPNRQGDEGAHFSDSADIADNSIALMRQVEGRVKAYRDAIVACERALATLRSDRAAAEVALAAWSDRLAEARHDVAVTRALIAEENERLAAINTRRASVLRDEVRFLAYIRPHETHSLAATPIRTLDPGLLEAPVPTCLREHADVPDELDELLALLRESPVNWFSHVPSLVARLDRKDLLVRTLASAQIRSQVFALKAMPAPIAVATPVRNAIGFVKARQQQSIAATRVLTTAIDVAQLASASWQGARAQVASVISLGDLIDGEHGSGRVARDAAAAFDRMSGIVGCLHAEFSAVLPATRLIWAERLSQFDAAPSLRDLSVLPRWADIPYIDRRQMQAYVDWLFDQIDARQPQAEGLMNDVVRMCLLLAADAPVGRIIAGRLPRPAVVRPGSRLPLTAFDASKLRLGMHALVYRGPDVVARAVIEDIGSEISARVVHTQTAEVSLDVDARVQFAAATQVSLAPAVLNFATRLA